MNQNEADLIQLDGVDRVFNRRRILLVLLIPLAMTLMAISSLNVALSTIESALHASDSDIQWVLSGYALVYGITLIPSGRIGDLLGRGRLFLIGVAVFSTASLFCAIAWSPTALIVARVSQGIGSGMIGPQITGMITQYFSGQDRARAFALFGVVVSASVAVGPMLTGIIIAVAGDALGWRASFGINVLAGMLAIWLGLRWFPFEMERQRRAARSAGELQNEKLDLDPFGALLLVAGVLTLMLPFVLQRRPLYLLVVVGVLLIVLWVRWEKRYQLRGGEPMVDLAIFRYRSFSTQTILSSSQFFASTPTFAIMALFVQQTLGFSALEAALLTLPNAIVSGFFAKWSGRYALQQGRTLLVVAFSLIAGSMICNALLIQLSAPIWLVGVALGMMGAGQGMVGSANQTLALAELPSSVGGTAGGIKQTGERIGTAIGQAIITAVFFGVSSTSAHAGVVAAYGVSSAILLIVLLLAVYDRRVEGPGVPLSRQT